MIIITIINITPPLIVSIAFLLASDGEGLGEDEGRGEEEEEEKIDKDEEEREKREEGEGEEREKRMEGEWEVGGNRDAVKRWDAVGKIQKECVM